MIAKSFSTAGRSPWRARIAAITSSMASARVLLAAGMTARPMSAKLAFRCLRAASIGMIARG